MEALLRVFMHSLQTHKPVVEIRNAVVRFGKGRAAFPAVDGVSFSIAPGEVLGLVGESGSGKTTVARSILGLTPLYSGEILVEGLNWVTLRGARLRRERTKIQMVFQNPFNSLNPRMTVFSALAEPLCFHARLQEKKAGERVGQIMEEVGLDPLHMRKYPHEFSGGQRQRIAIARALAVGPKLLVADEPLSALDASVQSQIINLLSDLVSQKHLAMLFITHDLSVVRYLSYRAAVIYRGRIMEMAPTSHVFSAPVHPYTRELLAAVPVADPGKKRAYTESVLARRNTETVDQPEHGCPFSPRCPWVIDGCLARQPLLEPLQADDSHLVACIRKHEIGSPRR